MDEIELYDVVELKEGIPGTEFRKGLSGTVIDRFPTGALEVEFEELEEKGCGIVSRGFWPYELERKIAFADMVPGTPAPVTPS